MEDLKTVASRGQVDRFVSLVEDWVRIENRMTEISLEESKIIQQGGNIGSDVSARIDRVCDEFDAVLMRMLSLSSGSAMTALAKLNMWLHIQGYRPQDKSSATLADQLAFQAIDDLNAALSWPETVYSGLIDPQDLRSG